MWRRKCGAAASVGSISLIWSIVWADTLEMKKQGQTALLLLFQMVAHLLVNDFGILLTDCKRLC